MANETRHITAYQVIYCGATSKGERGYRRHPVYRVIGDLKDTRASLLCMIPRLGIMHRKEATPNCLRA